MSPFWFICVILPLALSTNDPKLSNYFIGKFIILVADNWIPVPYPPGYCLKDGLGGKNVIFECSSDKQSIIKKFYDTNDDDCSGAETKTETFSYDSNIEFGDLNDFNCNGSNNAVGYKTYLTTCAATPVGTAWLATDICYKYQNMSNITGNLGNWPDTNPEEYYQLSQLNMCDGCNYTMETYVGEQDKVNKQCPNKDKPLTRYKGDPGCDLLFMREGFKVFADVIACVKDGINQMSVNGSCELPPTPGPTSTDYALKIHLYYVVIISFVMINML